MTVATLTTFVRDLTNTNSTTLTDANVLTWLNIKYGLRILDILHVQVDRNASQTEATTNLVATTDLTAGDIGYNGEYPFPTDLLKPVRVEIEYTDDEPVRASIYDLEENDYSEYNEDDINAQFSEAEPYVRFDRSSFFIRPLPDTSVTSGIHIWYEQRQTDLSTGSPDFEANLHNILAYDVAEIEYIKHADNYSFTQYQRFKEDKADIEKKFFQFYKNQFKRNLKFSPNYGGDNLSYV